MHTRKDYLEGIVSHQEYYIEIAKECGISFEGSSDLKRFKGAYGIDQHFNNIPLSYWDSLGMFSKQNMNKAFKARGDQWSAAGSVCVFKASARDAVLKEKGGQE